MSKVYRIGVEQEWKFEQIDEKYMYQRKIILTGSPTTYTTELKINYPFQIDRINLSFQNENKKSIKIKIYDYDDIRAYEYLRKIHVCTKQNFLLEMGLGYYYRTGSTIKIEIPIFTDSDTVSIQLNLSNLVLKNDN